MPTMLRHKVTGELFIFTADLAKNEFLEPFVPDPVAEALATSEVAKPETVKAGQTLAKTSKRSGGK